MSSLKHPRRVLAEAELISSHFGEIEFEDNWILVEQFNLPPTFNQITSRLLIILSDNYPESPPKDLYLEKRLKKNGKTPEHYFENKYGDSDIRNSGYAWYSIHFTAWRSSSISIIQGDNLITAIIALYDALKYDEKER
jgi:hypothetical protein